MEQTIHPLTPQHLPAFFTAPGQTDALLVGVGIFLIVSVIGIGVFYFRLHALPEQLAHGGQKLQFQIVAVLALISLFTHNHAFWIAGLLLALVPMPDFTTPLTSMAESLGMMARRNEPPVADSSANARERDEEAPEANTDAGSHG